jgi:CxxC motif-containing protein
LTNEKEIRCIVCPLGCKLHVRLVGKKFDLLKGNKCRRGIEYAKDEMLNPKRMLTTSVLVKGGEWPLVSVRTSQPVSKEKLFPILEKIKHTTVKAPVHFRQVILENVANSGADIIATKPIYVHGGKEKVKKPKRL